MEGWLAAWPLLLPVFFLLCGFGIGGFMERSHLKRLDRKERELRDMVVCNLKRVPDLESAESSTMVMGQVVIATDYFKSFVTALRNLVGGEMKAANKLMNRGRREALMRLMEDAQRHGANEIYNVRFGFSSINQMNGRRGGAMQVEVLAWGTAVKRR